jgi:predicted TIM-barrel fold metal-dependent hydrolase
VILVHPALEPFAEEVRRLRPPGAEVVEVHAHLGDDEDGRSMRPAELLAAMDELGVARACVFPLHDPDRRPAYRRPNDRVLDWAAESGGRLVPFCRLDPADGPIAEAERCLAQGARGIKLHPRAQAFGFADGAADEIFALAEQARVPVLVHAGRGMAPIAEGLSRAALRHPGLRLILAHGALADQATFAALLADHPGAMYDTSCFAAADVLELMARVPPERILFGADPPYGSLVTGLYLTLRCAAAVGLDEERVRLMIGGTAAALIDGADLPPRSAPAGSRVRTQWGALTRVQTYGVMAFTALWLSGPDAMDEGLDLALAACRDPDADGAGPALERIARTLAAAREAAAEPAGARTAVPIVHAALTLAATEPGPGG